MVLGSGIDILSPENKGLMEKIAASGCVVSEFSRDLPTKRIFRGGIG
jgi:predicted Rossmann fold nucleotide-binding protein DprA/Smf involved in DNA uptake